MRNTIEVIRPWYTTATLFVLARESTAGWQNVYTAAVYGSDLTVSNVFSTECAIGEISGVAYEAHRLVLTADDADTFIKQAAAGQSVLAAAGRTITYTTGHTYESFLPRSTFQTRDTPAPSSTSSCWRRRRFPERRLLGDQELTEGNLASIALDLPRFADVDYGLLNLRGALDSLATIDQIFPTGLTMNLRVEGNAMSYDIADLGGWYDRFISLEAIISTYDYGERVGTKHLVITDRAGTLDFSGHGNDLTLLGDGMLIDGSAGYFIHGVRIDSAIAEPDATVVLGHQAVMVPVAPRLPQQTRVGEQGTQPSIASARSLAELWRNDAGAQTNFAERVFEGSDGATCRADGVRMLSDLIAVVGRGQSVVRVVDKYALEAEALMAIVPLAAGIPNATISILTKNIEPCNENETEPSGNSADDPVERFRETATVVAKRFGVTIEWVIPTTPLHDRFLQIGDRIWHVGHSFNRLGCDLSAIVEFRDLRERYRLVKILDQQFAIGGETFR